MERHLFLWQKLEPLEIELVQPCNLGLINFLLRVSGWQSNCYLNSKKKHPDPLVNIQYCQRYMRLVGKGIHFVINHIFREVSIAADCCQNLVSITCSFSSEFCFSLFLQIILTNNVVGRTLTKKTLNSIITVYLYKKIKKIPKSL